MHDNIESSLKKMNFLVLLITILLQCPIVYGQVIQTDTEIDTAIRVNDTVDLQFLNGPGCGAGWNQYSGYDTTVIRVRLKSDRLMDGQKPVGGRHIETLQFRALKPGEANLEFFLGRPWLKEKNACCRIRFHVSP